MEQFKERNVFQCRQCGQILRTDRGLALHEAHCKLAPDKNQISLLDYEGGVLKDEPGNRQTAR